MQTDFQHVAINPSLSALIRATRLYRQLVVFYKTNVILQANCCPAAKSAVAKEFLF